MHQGLSLKQKALTKTKIDCDAACISGGVNYRRNYMTEYQRMQIGMIYDRFDGELANKQDSMYLKAKRDI